MKRDYIYIAGILVICFLFYRQCGRASRAENTIDVINDSLRISINKNGQMESRIKSFEGIGERMFLSINSKDSTITWLQKTVREYKGKLLAASVVSASTSSRGSASTTITAGDTVFSGDTIKVFPVYEAMWENKWEKGEVRAGKDSIYRDIKIHNEYEFTLGEERNGWFKRKEMEIKMTNLNPNTVTTELRSYNVKQSPKRFNAIAYVGYGFSSSGISPQVGIGIGYTLLSIK